MFHPVDSGTLEPTLGCLLDQQQLCLLLVDRWMDEWILHHSSMEQFILLLKDQDKNNSNVFVGVKKVKLYINYMMILFCTLIYMI